MRRDTRSGVRRKSPARDAAYIALAAALIAVCAWIEIPFGPIPFTMQTFAVAFVGALLGWKRGTAAVGVYVLMGLVGIPVFSGFRAGAAALFGPTGGYIVGFFFEALLPALFKKIPVEGFARMAVFYAAMVLGLAVTYAFGTAWFVLSYGCTVGYALAVCVLPYLAPDAVKLAVASALAVRLEGHIG